MDLNIHPQLPSRKDYRIGVLGSGFIVNDCHLVAYRKAGFNPVAIASRTKANAINAADRHEIKVVYDTYEDLLNDSSIEVLDIAVPPNAQVALIKAACQRGTVKGILAQKPLGMNYPEALEAVQVCEAAGITLAVNQNMRYDQSVRAGKTLLERGRLGQPVFATIDMRAIPHWMPWQKELGWVTLRIMSIHHLDTFRYWFGDPERIFCSARTDPRTNFPHKDGICTYILEYSNGLRCVGIDDTWTGPAHEGAPADIYIKWRIEGLDGFADGEIGWCKDPYTSPSLLRYGIKGQSTIERPRWQESWFPDAFIGTMAQLLCALENKQTPEISGRDNLRTMALVEAAYLSIEQRRSVGINEILGATEAPVGEAVKTSGTPDLSTHSNKALELARKEAERLNHSFIGTEHLLLGLLETNNGVNVAILHEIGLDRELVRREIEKVAKPGVTKPFGDITYTPPVQKILSIANREATRLRDNSVTPDHLYLGLLQTEEGLATKVLNQMGVNRKQVRERLQEKLEFM